MKLLVRNEIQEFFQENGIDYKKHIQTLLETSNVNDCTVINFNIENATILNIDNDDTMIQYLKYKNPMVSWKYLNQLN